MGQTLTNGVYLPDEGERNCYAGLAANWRIVDGHVGDTGIHVTYEDKNAWNTHIADTVKHVTAADKEAWNGKADASALTAHTGDTTIHVTAEDKSKWDAVTTKANDADVMHLTGDENSTGKKVFGDMATFDGSYLGDEASTNARTDLVLESNRDTHGQSGLYFTKFRQNKPQGGLTGSDVVYFTLDILENSVRTNNAIRFNFRDFVNDVPTSVAFYPTGINNSLGGSTSATNKWTKINGVEPGALSLPNLSAGVDISGYITAGNTHNEYTPTVDGWISVALKSTSGACALWIYQNDLFNGYYGSSPRPGESEPFAATCLPVKANTVVNIDTKGSNSYVYTAKFYPCTGNV